MSGTNAGKGRMRVVVACMMSLLLALGGVPAQAIEEVAEVSSETAQVADTTSATTEDQPGASDSATDPAFDGGEASDSAFEESQSGESAIGDIEDAYETSASDQEGEDVVAPEPLEESEESAQQPDQTEADSELLAQDNGEGTPDNPASLESAVVSAANQTYTGAELTPAVTVKLNDTELVKDTDFTVGYADNTDVGTATITVTGMGSYKGTATGTFTIKAASIKSASITGVNASYVYTADAIKPSPKVALAGTTLQADQDYTLTYKANKNVGTATITIRGTGNYTGAVAQTFQITAASISKTSAAAIANQAYTGKAVTPKVSLTYNGSKVSTADYTLSYANNRKAGTATVTVKGTRNFTGTKKLTFKIVAPSVTYMAHVQSIGDQAWRKDGVVSGTSGKGKRIEALRLKLGTGFPVSGGITYRAHVQSIGWQDWRSDGKLAGTSGKSKRVEAIRIKLTGDMAKKYDVYYRVHVQKVGWMAWTKNGLASGTIGMGWRIEAFQVVLVPKGQAAPGKVADITSATTLSSFSKGSLTYRSWIQGMRWQEWKGAGSESGAAGKSKRITGIQAKLDPTSSLALKGSLSYRTHLSGSGWSDWVADGKVSGTAGGSTRVETMQVKLKGTISKYVDVWYRAYVQGIGWMGWAKNGQSAGTTGASRRLEAYEIQLTPKDAAAPGSTADHYLTKAEMDRRAEEEALRAMQADPMYWAAQGYYSPTSWLLMVDCTTCSLGIFKGSQGNWRMYDKYLVGVGRYENPSRHGVWSVGDRGYAFGGSDYTCYYWVQYYNDYLFHTVPCWAGTYDIKDGRLGEHVSAGCVRQPFDKAIWLYNNIPYGTTVVVYDS